MQSFKDAAGRSWDLKVGIAEAKLIKGRLELNILDDTDLATLTADSLKVADLVWILCERQATERRIAEDDFYELLIEGETFEQVTCRLIGELADFFRRMGKTMLAGICTETLRARPMALAAMERQSPKLAGKVESLIETAEAELEAALMVGK